jgi:hypothetical protein
MTYTEADYAHNKRKTRWAVFRDRPQGSFHGLMPGEGSVTDLSLVAVPRSTKNAQGQRDPDMYSVKRGNEW